MKEIKRIIAILAMVILLFCNGCQWSDPPYIFITCSNEEEFISWIEENVAKEDRRNVYLLRFPIEDGWILSSIHVTIATSPSRHYIGQTIYAKQENFVQDMQIYVAASLLLSEGRNPEENYDGDKVEEIEIDSMKGSVIKLKEQDSSIKKYAIYVQSEKMNFSVRITVEGNNQIEEREIVELARGIIQTRYLPFKEGEKI